LPVILSLYSVCKDRVTVDEMTIVNEKCGELIFLESVDLTNVWRNIVFNFFFATWGSHEDVVCKAKWKVRVRGLS